MQHSDINLKNDRCKRTTYRAEGGHDWFHIERVYKNAC
jgi:HD superfamily phosphodiesterase